MGTLVNIEPRRPSRLERPNRHFLETGDLVGSFVKTGSPGDPVGTLVNQWEAKETCVYPVATF